MLDSDIHEDQSLIHTQLRHGSGRPQSQAEPAYVNEWDDYEQRRKKQNRIAQRKYRQRLKDSRGGKESEQPWPRMNTQSRNVATSDTLPAASIPSALDRPDDCFLLGVSDISDGGATSDQALNSIMGSNMLPDDNDSQAQGSWQIRATPNVPVGLLSTDEMELSCLDARSNAPLALIAQNGCIPSGVATERLLVMPHSCSDVLPSSNMSNPTAGHENDYGVGDRPWTSRQVPHANLKQPSRQGRVDDSRSVQQPPNAAYRRPPSSVANSQRCEPRPRALRSTSLQPSQTAVNGGRRASSSYTTDHYPMANDTEAHGLVERFVNFYHSAVNLGLLPRVEKFDKSVSTLQARMQALTGSSTFVDGNSKLPSRIDLGRRRRKASFRRSSISQHTPISSPRPLQSARDIQFCCDHRHSDHRNAEDCDRDRSSLEDDSYDSHGE